MDGAVIWVAQPQMSWMATTTFPIRYIHCGSDAPDRGLTFDFGEIPFVQLGYLVAKIRRITIQFIGSQLGKRQSAPLDGSTQQFQANFGLGFGLQLCWRTTRHAFIGVFIIKPAFRHEQSSFNQAVSFAAGVSQINVCLTVGHLPNRATVLSGYPTESSPCFTTPDSSIKTTPSASPNVSATSF